jgi:hypothetical protein
MEASHARYQAVRVQMQRESLSLAATVMAVRASILDVYMYVGVRSGLYYSTCNTLVPPTRRVMSDGSLDASGVK